MLSLRVELQSSRLLNGCSNQLNYESTSLYHAFMRVALMISYLLNNQSCYESMSHKFCLTHLITNQPSFFLDSYLLNNQPIYEIMSLYHAFIECQTLRPPLTKRVL